MTLRSLPGVVGRQFMAVVKADAYGHGLIPVAQRAVRAGVEWLGVATVTEGVRLREAGVTTAILVLCAPAPQEAWTLLQCGLTATVGDSATMDALVEARRSLNLSPSPAVHLEIDTGMGRAGVAPEAAVAFWRRLVSAGLRVTGLMTHFSSAEEDAEFTRQQCDSFQRVRAELERAGAVFEWVHLSNSAGAVTVGTAEGNLIRAGLLLYGICPTVQEASIDYRTFQLAMTVKARVATVRSLPAGHPISYGATHRLVRPSLVATALIGYGDGYPRRLSNIGAMLLRGQRAPILGRVCMDQTVLDVTDIPGVEAGEEAVCIGRQGEACIRVEEIAVLLETTEHEITTCLTARLPRVFL